MAANAKEPINDVKARVRPKETWTKSYDSWNLVMDLDEALFMCWLDNFSEYKSKKLGESFRGWVFLTDITIIQKFPTLKKGSIYRLLQRLMKNGLLQARDGHEMKKLYPELQIGPKLLRFRWVKINYRALDKKLTKAKAAIPTKQQQAVWKDTSGWIYIFKAENGMFKIGKTGKNPKGRLRTICTISPVPISLLHAIETNDITWLENRLHAKYTKSRCHGEWFRLEEKNVRWLMSQTCMHKPT